MSYHVELPLFCLTPPISSVSPVCLDSSSSFFFFSQKFYPYFLLSYWLFSFFITATHLHRAYKYPTAFHFMHWWDNPRGFAWQAHSLLTELYPVQPWTYDPATSFVLGLQGYTTMPSDICLFTYFTLVDTFHLTGLRLYINKCLKEILENPSAICPVFS